MRLLRVLTAHRRKISIRAKTALPARHVHGSEYGHSLKPQAGKARAHHSSAGAEWLDVNAARENSMRATDLD